MGDGGDHCPNSTGRAGDVVLGLADDGGYYLLGLKHPAPRLLREVQMSTPTVTADTLALAKEARLRVELLPTWYDVDDADALARLATELAQISPDVARHTHTFFALNKGIEILTVIETN